MTNPFADLRPRHIRQLKRAARALDAQEAAEESARRREAVRKPHPCWRWHRDIGRAVEAGDLRRAQQLLEQAPTRYRAVFWWTRWASRVFA